MKEGIHMFKLFKVTFINCYGEQTSYIENEADTIQEATDRFNFVFEDAQKLISIKEY